MNRAWFILLAFSVGLNGAFLYDRFLRQPQRHSERPTQFDRGGAAPWMRDRYGDSLSHERAQRFLDRRLRRMGEELDLTGGQHAAVREIHEGSMEHIMRMRRETRAIRDSFHALMVEPEFDAVRFRALGAELHEKQRALEMAIMDNLIREAALLTPEQRARYQNMMMGPWRYGDRGGPRRRRH